VPVTLGVMKIVVIGASGTIGRAVSAALAERHEVVAASRRGPTRVDLADPASIEALFDTVRDCEAVVCCAEGGALTPLESSSDDAFFTGLEGKLLGQVRLVRAAARRMPRGGSVTLTSGRFDGPLPGSTFGRLVNEGLEAFVRAAAAELPGGPRVNVVSPGWVRETLAAFGEDGGVPADVLARVYLDAVEGVMTGSTLTVR
jgi:NAD(P)-dependent dehydrogenase (short-subunit alcohol dehydrogenase family)